MFMKQVTKNMEFGRALRLGVFVVLGLHVGYGKTFAAAPAYTLPYAEDFELPLTAGTAIGNVGAWESDSSDDSFIENEEYYFSETRRPIVPSADAQVLQLQAGSNEVRSVFAVPDLDQVVYLDSMLKLAPRSGIPASVTNDPTVQLFFYLNAETNLVVYHGGPDGAAPGMTVIPVDPQVSRAWNRFTVTLDYVHGDAGLVERKYYKVQLNGSDLTSAQAYSAPGKTGAYDGGAWFFTVDQTGPDGIASVAFEGVGGLDDLVVSTHTPVYNTEQMYSIVSSLSGQGAVMPADRVSVVAGTSTQIVYQADAWHEIAAFEQNGIVVPEAIGSLVYTSIFFNVQTDRTNRVEFTESVAFIDGKTPASWYGPLGADPTQTDEDEDGLSLYEEFLLNTDPVVFNRFVLFQYGLDALGWESLALPYGRVIPEVSTNLVEGDWIPLGGYLTQIAGATLWHFPEDLPEESFFLRVNVVE